MDRKTVCNQCKKIKKYINGKYYGAGEWMCQDCLNKLSELSKDVKDDKN